MRLSLVLDRNVSASLYLTGLLLFDTVLNHTPARLKHIVFQTRQLLHAFLVSQLIRQKECRAIFNSILYIIFTFRFEDVAGLVRTVGKKLKKLKTYCIPSR